LLAATIVIVFTTGCSASDPQHTKTDHTSLTGVLAETSSSSVSCQRSSPATPVVQTARSRFPLKVEPGRRYLSDRQGKPFLIQGDSAWSLIAELTDKEVDKYLADRKRRGFNTILVNLLEHQFASKAPANAYGDTPFTTPGDFSKPNEAYFRHADRVLERASSMGFLVLMAPAYIGARNSAQGWWKEMAENGPETLRNYGRYLGRRYSRFHNIMWVEGGDDDPPIEGLVDALAAGIAETNPGALQTGHPAPESAPLETWDGRTWFDVNNVYTYKDVYARSMREYRRSKIPFFLMESAYEGEHSVSARRLRTQAWHALLAGATGQLFGNNPIWHFSGPGLYGAPVTWEQALDSPGARSMGVVAKFYGTLAWWRLIPDEAGKPFIVGGRGRGDERAAAGVSCDGRWGIVYVPTRRLVTLDLRAFRGSRVTLTWIDPSNGARTAATPSSVSVRRSVRLVPPQRNASDESDWVLRIMTR
jgi:hypothetical protein